MQDAENIVGLAIVPTEANPSTTPITDSPDIVGGTRTLKDSVAFVVSAKYFVVEVKTAGPADPLAKTQSTRRL